MKDSHLVIAIIVFIGLLAYVAQAMRKIKELELQKSVALNSADNLKIQKSDLEVENHNLENLLDKYRIPR